MTPPDRAAVEGVRQAHAGGRACGGPSLCEACLLLAALDAVEQTRARAMQRLQKFSTDCFSQGCKRAEYEAKAHTCDEELEATLATERAARERAEGKVAGLEGFTARLTARAERAGAEARRLREALEEQRLQMRHPDLHPAFAATMTRMIDRALAAPPAAEGNDE